MEINSGASAEEVKKSFRRLAHLYHPDKNTTNNFAEARFREIHEAYVVLSNEQKRTAYDNERWLSGRFKKNAAVLTPHTFHAELVKLNKHLAELDVYRMNRQLLHEYLLFLLAPDKAAVLVQQGSASDLQAINNELLHAVAFLPGYFSLPVLKKWKDIIRDVPEIEGKVEVFIQKVQSRETRRKAYPWLIVVLVVLLLLGMYLFSKSA